MEEVYDLMAGLLATKADERMIGFAGFTREAPPGGEPIEGILKASAFHRPDGSGYLTLTFIQDREHYAGGIFANPDQEAFRALLGPNFDMLMDISLNTFSDISAFFVEELDVYFHQLHGQERVVLESSLMPVLTQLLGLDFKSLQEWPPRPLS
jgi:hypothetical protein